MNTSKHSQLNGLRSLHTWLTWLVSPFLLVVTLTGMLYALNPQIEWWQTSHLTSVQGKGTSLPLNALVEAGQSHMQPGYTLHSATIPANPHTQSLQLNWIPVENKTHAQNRGEHAGHGGSGMRKSGRPAFVLPDNALIQYVNPHNGSVIGQMALADQFAQWSKHLHSRLLAGKALRWVSELAATALFWMLVTGVWLWALGPTVSQHKSRLKRWHIGMGLGFAAFTVVMTATGLTWSEYAGQQVRTLVKATGQSAPKIPDKLHSAESSAGQTLWGWNDALAKTRQLAGPVEILLIPPGPGHNYWLAIGSNPAEPTHRFDLALDASDGQILYRSTWANQTLFGKATAIGIPFHRGEFGLWNQLLLMAFGGFVLFALGSAWTLQFGRRKRNGVWFNPSAEALHRVLPKSFMAAWLMTSALLPLSLPLGGVVLLLDRIRRQG